MKFIGRADEQSGRNTISDEFGVVPYSALIDAWPLWNEWLERERVERNECLMLPTQTTARSAIALLAMFARGQSVLLWRRSTEELPPYCRRALVDQRQEADFSFTPDGWSILSCKRDLPETVVKASYVYLPTSGTTGSPKVVAFELGTLLDNAWNCIDRLGLNLTDRVLIPVPLAHMYGLGAALLPAVLAGACVHLIPQANLLSYLRVESDFNPTVAFLTPNFCHLLVRGRKRGRHYRLTVVAGDRLEENTFSAYEQRHGCTVNLYGSSELGVISAGCPQESFVERRDTAGMPLPGVQVAPAGDSGSGSFQLCIDHPFGCAGYPNDEGRPLKPPSLYKDGWYFTQDMGRLNPAGRVQLAGRIDHTVKRDGFMVAFADVERALQQLDEIEHAVIVPAGITPRGRELVAVYTATSGAPVDTAALRRSAMKYLPSHAVPDRFFFVEKMPQTETGKPDRMALEALISGTIEGPTNAEPR